MAAKTISGFIIALLMVGLTAAAMGLFIGQVNSDYTRSDYNESEFEDFNKLTELTSIANETQSATDINVEPGITDIIGGYFKSAYQALKVSVASLNIFNSLVDTAAEKSGISYLGVVKKTLQTIAIIAIFIGIFISAMVKKDV